MKKILSILVLCQRHALYKTASLSQGNTQDTEVVWLVKATGCGRGDQCHLGFPSLLSAKLSADRSPRRREGFHSSFRLFQQCLLWDGAVAVTP